MEENEEDEEEETAAVEIAGSHSGPGFPVGKLVEKMLTFSRRSVTLSVRMSKLSFGGFTELREASPKNVIKPMNAPPSCVLLFSV